MQLNVRSWLEAGGFGQFADLFESRQIDGDALLLLTDADLRELGLALGPRVKILEAISQLATTSAQATATAERRRLTVMFVDLVGSTRLSGELDPEDLRNLIRTYQRAVATEVARFDGHVAQYLGDGALVYFGYPRAHEGDAERAVRVALAIVRAIADLRSPAGRPLAAHIGIATGLVVVGDLLGAAKEHAVAGETPNLAARLLELAGPGDVVVSAATHALTGNAFDSRDLGLCQLKGMKAPVKAYSVLAERTVETRFEARYGKHIPAMVGRDGELALLNDRWQQATSGEGVAVLLTGEAGIGKSRIVRAISDSLVGVPHVRISNQCSPYHRDTALHPMIQQLTHAAGIEPGDSREVRLDRLEALLEGADRADLALFAALLGIDAAERYGNLGLTPEQQRARTFEALLNQVIRASTTAPVFWVLEDAHWIDPTTLELVGMCLDRIGDSPILAIITARPEFTQDFGVRKRLTRVSLGRLSRRPIAAMVNNLAHGKSLPELVLQEIVAKTDGVPLFVEELTKTILESGALRETEDAYVLDGTLHDISVPASLYDSMMARLDRHPSLKVVAQCAACIGREFDYGLLATISQVPEEMLRDTLGRLVAAEIIYRRGVSQELYAFKHALVRDAAYESLLRSMRRKMHARILAALEAGPVASLEILAQHATEAGFAEKAIDYWQKAGALAISRPAYQEASAHINQALALAKKMPDERPWQERRLQLMLMLLGQATIPLRGYGHSESLEVLARAQALVQQISDSPYAFSVLYTLWVTYFVRGEHQEAIDIAKEMRSYADTQSSDSQMLASLRALGISQMILGEPTKANATFGRAQQLVKAVQQQPRDNRMQTMFRVAADPEIATQFHVALTLWSLGHVDQASGLVIRSIAAARATGDVHTLGHALTHGAIYAVVARDPEEALRLSNEAIAFADEYDMDLWRGYGAILNGYARVLTGDVTNAVQVMEAGFRHLVHTETGTMVPVHHAVQAYALARLGRYDEAARESAIVQDELRSGSERFFWPESLRWLGDYQRLVPDASMTAVESYYSDALAQARAQQAMSWELGAAISLSRLWAERGECDRAVELLAPIVAGFREGFDTTALREATALLAAWR